MLVPGGKSHKGLMRLTTLNSYVHPCRTSGPLIPRSHPKYYGGGYREGGYEVSADSIYATKPMLPAET